VSSRHLAAAELVDCEPDHHGCPRVVRPDCVQPIQYPYAVTDNEVDVPKPTSRSAGIKLNSLNRAIAFILGIAGLGAGGAAVYLTHLEAGPVGLMAVGLIFMIIALGGVLPSRLKVGENEATWEAEREAVGRFVERVAEGTPVVNQREFLGALSDLAEKAPEVAARGVSAVAYEQQLRAEIEDVLHELEDNSVTGRLPRYSSGIFGASRNIIDATIRTPHGRLVRIEMRVSETPLSATWVEGLHQKLNRMSSDYGDNRVMLAITKVPLTHAAQDLLQRYPEIHYVLYRGPEDREELKRALREVIA
jgi:hypothetical protein